MLSAGCSAGNGDTKCNDDGDALAGELRALPAALAASCDLLMASLRCFGAGPRVTGRLAGVRTVRQSMTACLPTLLLRLKHFQILHCTSTSMGSLAIQLSKATV